MSKGTGPDALGPVPFECLTSILFFCCFYFLYATEFHNNSFLKFLMVVSLSM